MNKQTRLEKTIAAEPTDRPPVALTRYFPGDDQRAGDLARSIVAFQNLFDWDYVRIVPANTFMIVDYGAQDAWDGSADGVRTCVKSPITRAMDWTALRVLDPTYGAMGRQLQVVGLVTEGVDNETPIVQTIYSPLAQASMLVGRDTLLRHLRAHPDRLHSGLAVLTESTLRFIEMLRRTPIAGLHLMIDHADYGMLSEAEYRTFGLPYDQRVLEAAAPRWWLNTVYVRGETPMLSCAAEWRAPILSWHDRGHETNLARGRLIAPGAVMGGLDAWTDLNNGSPAGIRDALREAAHQVSMRRWIAAPAGEVPITAPWSNLRAVRETVEQL